MVNDYKKVQIPFGFNSEGKQVNLSLFHSFFVAMTGHGKTVGMKSLLRCFHELYPDWKILIIDSKDKRDYLDLNADIPLCFVEATDALELKNLLEPIVGARMMYYFDKIIEEAVFDTLTEIHQSISKKIEDADNGTIKMSGKDLGKLRVIQYTLGKLVVLIDRPNIVSNLRLHDGFNVLPVSLPDVKNPNLKRAFQQLIVKSAILLLLANQEYEKTLLVLDESHKWSSQKYGSICKQPISEFVSEGRGQNKLLWIADQALTKVDKEPLKNIKVWVVGQQMESNEVEDARNTVNDFTDMTITDSDIKSLRIGNFIIVDGIKRHVEHAYLQPYGVPDDIAIQIAQGENPDKAEKYIQEAERHLMDEMIKESSSRKHELTKTEQKTNFVTKEEIITLRTDFFKKLMQMQSQVDANGMSIMDLKRNKSQINADEIVSLVLQKIPHLNKQEIVDEIVKRIPKITGTVTYEISPVEKLQKGFLEDAKTQILSNIQTLDEEQKKMLKFIEVLGKNTTITEILEKCLYLSRTSGGIRDRIGKKLKDMANSELINKDAHSHFSPNLKPKIQKHLEIYDGTPEEIQAVYDNILMEMLGGS